jgi:hypothetical protein
VASGHEETTTDGNDTKGGLDFSKVAVGHKGSFKVTHTITTRASWTARDLSLESFFVIAISFNDDHDYERCAYIFYVHRLRGSLTNCGNHYYRSLKVSKLSPRSARILIPKGELHEKPYWWAAISVWTADGACQDQCVDAVPNHFPLILHDIESPTISLDPAALLASYGSTSSSFSFPFSVEDGKGSGVSAWEVQAKEIGEMDWSVLLEGSGSGSMNPTFDGPEGSQRKFRVVATDEQGNEGSETRVVYVPFDDANPAWAGSFSGSTSSVADPDAYGGSYTSLDDIHAAFTYAASDPNPTDNLCRFFGVVGPGAGDWILSVSIDGTSSTTILGVNVPDGPRQLLYESAFCDASSTFTLELISGSGAGIDAAFA